MSTTTTAKGLFGAPGERQRPGYEDTEWSVWIMGPDEIVDRTETGETLTLTAALRMAGELNATFADMRTRSTSEFDTVMYAIVLHHGYAWSQQSEHAHGNDCGLASCAPCTAKRAGDAEPYPTQIVVFCDRCGTEQRGDYIVTDAMSKAERLEVARAYCQTLGWSCTANGDLCLTCAPYPTTP